MRFAEAVWFCAAGIPPGRVTTYGHIATALGSPRAARAVGYALFRVVDGQVPWHRVVNARGEISIGGHLHRPDQQRQRLERVVFDAADRLDLRRLLWPRLRLPRGWRPVNPATARR